jgi:hypothetical protein
MSENLWESQLEINKIFDKRLALAEEQLTALTQLVIELSKVLNQVVKPTEPTEPTGCTGKHCACKDGEM